MKVSDDYQEGDVVRLVRFRPSEPRFGQKYVGLTSDPVPFQAGIAGNLDGAELWLRLNTAENIGELVRLKHYNKDIDHEKIDEAMEMLKKTMNEVIDLVIKIK